MAKKKEVVVKPKEIKEDKEEVKVVPKKPVKVEPKKEEPIVVKEKGLDVMVEGVRALSFLKVKVMGADMIEVKDFAGTSYLMTEEQFNNLKKV